METAAICANLSPAVRAHKAHRNGRTMRLLEAKAPSCEAALQAGGRRFDPVTAHPDVPAKRGLPFPASRTHLSAGRTTCAQSAPRSGASRRSPVSLLGRGGPMVRMRTRERRSDGKNRCRCHHPRPVDAVYQSGRDGKRPGYGACDEGTTWADDGGNIFTFDRGKGRTSTMRYTALEPNQRIDIEGDVGLAKPAGYLLFERERRQVNEADRSPRSKPSRTTEACTSARRIHWPADLAQALVSHQGRTRKNARCDLGTPELPRTRKLWTVRGDHSSSFSSSRTRTR